MNNKVLKIAGYVCAGAGAVISIASTLVDQKQRDTKIKNEVAKQFAEYLANMNKGA